jgi:hypothetical protein
MLPVVYVIMVLSFTPHKPDAHWVPASGVYLTIKECRENLGPPPGYPGNMVHGEYAEDSRSSVRQRCVAYVPGKVVAVAQTPPPPPPTWVLMETGNTHPLGTFPNKEECEEMRSAMIKSKAEAGDSTVVYRCIK